MLPGARLLEIGAGEGIALRELVARYGVTATATTLIAAPGSDFVTATAAALPFADNSFDVVLGIHSLTWEPNQQQALAEVHRVLRPGGRAFINLARFSEISTLWFGPKFWYDFDQATYIREYEPSEVDLAAARRVPGHPPAPYNYLLTIDKPA